MSNLSLTAKTREVEGKKVSGLREQGLIPAVLYGHGLKPISVSVPYPAFEKIYQAAGESTLVDLKLDDKNSVKVLIHDIQHDPITNRLAHVDFLQVRMDEEIHTKVPLKFIGIAPAIKELSGILVTNLNELEIKCLPNDLIHEIEVDLSNLRTFDDQVRVADLKVPAGIKVLSPADETVALVQEPREEQTYETTPVETPAGKEAAPAAEPAEPESK